MSKYVGELELAPCFKKNESRSSLLSPQNYRYDDPCSVVYDL